MGVGGAGCRVLLAGPDPPPGRLGPCETVWVKAVRVTPIPGGVGALLALGGWMDSAAFTSPRAPRILAGEAGRLGVLGSVRRLLGGVSVYAIGPRTAEAVRESLGVEVAGVPGEYRGLALAGLIASRGSRRVAGIRSPQALPDLPEALAERGVAFVDVYIYSTSIDLEALRAARGLGFDYLAATSPRIGEAMVEAGLQGTYIAIGPTTARALRLHGVEPACTAEPHTLRGVARCLEALESGASGPR